MSRRLRKITFSVWMSMILVVAALPVGLSIDPSQASAATAFSNVTMNTTTPAQNAKFEISFNLGTTYTNPFNPDEVNVYATFTTPSGAIEVVPGFYKSNSSPNWAVRYSPRQAGNHSVVVRVVDASGIGQSNVYTFTAGGPGNNRGFMGVQGERFVDSFGSQVTLIGTNFAWNNPDPNAVINEIPNLKPAKMNALRVWYSCWWSSLAPEWGPIVSNEAGLTTTYEGIGKYQLDNQARVDQMFEAAEANDVYIMFTMLSFGDFYYQWGVNAYNQANGGPNSYSDNNTDFWTNPTSIDYQKKLLRYVFARYGYSRALGMLEYWNELDNHVDTTATNRANWHAAVDNYWKSLDFYNHPTTTSFAWKDHAGSGQTSWENLNTLDVTNVHRYDSSANVVDAWEEQIENLHVIGGNRPAFIGEIGRTHEDQTTDPTIANYMHNALWGPVFRAGAAGGSMWWIFENGFALPSNFKSIHTRLANFVQPEEDHLIDMPHIDYGLQSNSTKVGGFNDGSRAMLWINDTLANHTVTSPRTVSGMSVSVPMTNGYYDVTYYNTYTGTSGSTTSVQATGGNLVLSVPSFSRDIAVNIKCESCDAPDTQAPSTPTNLTAPSKTDTVVNLSWLPSTDNVRVTEYDVYRGSTKIGSSSETNFSATGLTANTTYNFTVRAKDAANNVSASSSSLSVTTNPLDTQAPTAPTSLTSPTKLDISVNLTWNASSDNTGVTAYHVYRNGALVGTTNGTTVTYTDTGLTADTSYSYYVRASDARNNISTSSNTISVSTLEHIPLNKLLNSGFEQNVSGEVRDWTCENDYFCSWDTGVKRTGSASMKMSGDSGPWLGFYQDITATAGSSYTFDGYMNKAANSGTTVEFRLRFLDSSNNVIQDNLMSTHTGTASGFINVTDSKVAPANTAKARVYIYLKDLRGSIYFDDFSLIGGSGGGGGDTQAPTAPTSLTSPTKSTSTVDLSWTASSDNVGVTGYEIYRNLTLAGSTTGATTFQATGLTASTAYSFTVKAKDAANNESAASSALSVTTSAPVSGGSGRITWEYWTDISGTSITSIPLTTAPTSTSTLTSLEAPTNWANSYGTRIRGYIHPTTTGSYTFYVAGDDDSEVWLSTDSNPANKVKIAGYTGWTGSRDWNKYTSQASSAISLVAGQKYYVEVLHKEGDGGDNIAVGWTGPGISTITVIDGIYLSPMESTSTNNGVVGQYYDNMDFTGSSITRTDAAINFDWGNGSPDPAIGSDTFSVRWTGKVEAQFTQTYTFYTSSDDGVRLWVNGQLVIDKWINQATTEWSGTIALQAGQKYDLKLEYFDNTSGAVSKLSWSSTSQTKEIIPQSKLFTN